jgi:uncharacterized protein YwgA
MRLQTEIIQDRLLQLYLISSIQKNGFIDGNLKLQKLAFLLEWQLMLNNIKALHFKYFRYRYGPFSKELQSDNQNLQTEGYLTHQFNLTGKAVDLLEYVIEPIAKHGANQEIFNQLEDICVAEAKTSGSKLTDKVYRMEIVPHDMPGRPIKIRDIPAFVDILVPETFDSRYKLEIPADLIADIEEEFSGRTLTKKEEERLINESTRRLAKLISETSP